MSDRTGQQYYASIPPDWRTQLAEKARTLKDSVGLDASTTILRMEYSSYLHTLLRDEFVSSNTVGQSPLYHDISQAVIDHGLWRNLHQFPLHYDPALDLTIQLAEQLMAADMQILGEHWLVFLEEYKLVDRTNRTIINDEIYKGRWHETTLWSGTGGWTEVSREFPETVGVLKQLGLFRQYQAVGIPHGVQMPFACATFSLIGSGTCIWPHVGPTNARLRLHVGLSDPGDGCSLYLVTGTRGWREGEVTMLDDSYVHAVKNSTWFPRLALLIDFLKPATTTDTIRSLGRQIG